MFLHHFMKAFGIDVCLRTQPSLLMKPSLHCLGSHVDIPVGGPQGISIPQPFQSKLSNEKRNKTNVTSQTSMQEQQQGDLIKAQTLLTCAHEISKNGTKALACVMSKNSPYRDYAQNLLSGMVHDDNLEYVREQMYIVLNPHETAAVIGVGVVLRSNSDTSIGNNNILDAAAGLLDNNA